MKHETKAKPVKSYQPCAVCGSSDALTLYDDGHTYCFSAACDAPFHKVVSPEQKDLLENVPSVITAGVSTGSTTGVPIINRTPYNPNQQFSYEYVPTRGITRETMEKYGVYTKVGEDGHPIEIGFPYGPKTSPEWYKIRNLNVKSFHTVGDITDESPTLFGRDIFPSGSAKSITITEGEFDSLAVYQMLGSSYPSVSVRSSSSAKADCKREFDYLNSFERIYICFDADEPGERAAKAVANLFGYNKIYHVKLDTKLKDANGYLQENLDKAFKTAWYNARKIQPENILSTLSEFMEVIDSAKPKKGFPLPFPTLQSKLDGLKTGEAYLFTALEGVGKTEIIRAIEYEILKDNTHNIGVIHLEETKERLIKGYAGYDLNKPCHLDSIPVPPDEIKEVIQRLVKDDNKLNVYSHFGSDDPDVILSTIRFLVTNCGCKYIFLDHITMVVSGIGDEERAALDYISTNLAMMLKELDFCLVFVSHVNDEGKTRGSRNISKIATVWVHLDRNLEAETEEARNKTYLTIKKNRDTGLTGLGGILQFDLNTFKISELETAESKII